jgi:hypothetical protein
MAHTAIWRTDDPPKDGDSYLFRHLHNKRNVRIACYQATYNEYLIDHGRWIAQDDKEIDVYDYEWMEIPK